MDNAQAFGTLYKGRPISSCGRMATLSFYPTKNLPGIGDGGAVCCRDKADAELIRRIRGHQPVRANNHLYTGWNSRLDEVQAMVIRVRLARFADEQRDRDQVAAIYDSYIPAENRVQLDAGGQGMRMTYHQYWVRMQRPRRAAPRPGQGRRRCRHLLRPAAAPARAGRLLPGRRRPLPEAERAGREILTLPIHAALPFEDAHRVGASCANSCRRAGGTVREPSANPGLVADVRVAGLAAGAQPVAVGHRPPATAHAANVACQLELLASPQQEAQRARETFVAASRRRDRVPAQGAGRRQGPPARPRGDRHAGGRRCPARMIVCVPDRAAPFDAFLNRSGRIMDEMEPGSRVGVLSQRVRAQMQALWPDLRFEILRGGVDRAMETHLRRSEIDGLVLPASVTEHLGIQGIVAEIFAPEFVLPGPGQGTLVVLARDDDDEARELLAPLHSEDSALELAAETAFHRRMLPDQDLPVGALARVGSDGIAILGGTGAGRHRISVSGTVDEAEAVGDGLAQQLLSHCDTFVDLLEGDFPEGLPEEPDEDATLLGGLATEEVDEPFDENLEDLEELRGFEDLAGLIEDEDCRATTTIPTATTTSAAPTTSVEPGRARCAQRRRDPASARCRPARRPPPAQRT